MAVTDHDTTARSPTCRRARGAAGIEAITGIEITAVEGGRDVHMLGYFIDPDDAASGRVSRAAARADGSLASQAIVRRLAQLGMPVDLQRGARRRRGSRADALDRPAAGRARDGRRRSRRRHARGVRPLARAGSSRVRAARGPPPEEVIEHHSRRRRPRVAGASGPDARSTHAFPRLAIAGLDALEAYHSDHDAASVRPLSPAGDRAWVC